MEEADEAEYKREHMERARAAVKAAADHLEAERAEAKEAEWVEDDDFEEVEVATADSQLRIEAKVTEAASEDTARLWEGVSEVDDKSEAEKQALKLENLKRQYHNAISRLPYGIPSKEIADRDWVDLAAALATGQKKAVEGGKEVTNIDGRWYFSDHEDTGSFLKEHGAKPKPEAPKAAPPVATGKEALLAKLEERFILGEISEETYKELKQKYGG
jgi:hypothetical protein